MVITMDKTNRLDKYINHETTKTPDGDYIIKTKLTILATTKVRQEDVDLNAFVFTICF